MLYLVATFVFMSRPRSIYVVSLSSVSHFESHFYCQNHITSFQQTYLFSVHSLEYLLLFLDDNLYEESA